MPVCKTTTKTLTKGYLPADPTSRFFLKLLFINLYLQACLQNYYKRPYKKPFSPACPAVLHVLEA